MGEALEEKFRLGIQSIRETELNMEETVNYIFEDEARIAYRKLRDNLQTLYPDRDNEKFVKAMAAKTIKEILDDDL